VRRLGGGELYDTYLVWDERRFALAVAKLLRPDRVADAYAQRALRREADALARLGHPVVVRAFEVVRDGPHPHLLLEHLEGPSLRRLVKTQGPLPLEQVIPLALHIASALHYFSAEGVVHLDVKPENIIMGVPPRLVDLSLVHSLEEARELKTPVGTDAFMAPEQCDPDPALRGAIGPAADVFGLAATLHYALSGEVPFPRVAGGTPATLEDRFPQLVNPPAPLPGEVPAALAELIKRGLGADPARRPAASQLALALQPLVAGLPQRFVLTGRGWRAR
jgi:serine/threonine protein kinase